MLRKFVCGLCALLLGVGVLSAAEIKGKVKSADDKTLTVTVDDKDTTYNITDDAKIVGPGGKDVKDKAKALKNLGKGGSEVTLITEKKDDKEVVTQIKLAGKKKQQ